MTAVIPSRQLKDGGECNQTFNVNHGLPLDILEIGDIEELFHPFVHPFHGPAPRPAEVAKTSNKVVPMGNL